MKKWGRVNVLASAVAVFLCGYSFSAASPDIVVQSAQTLLANATVGMSAGVEPNPYNSLAQQLQKKADELNEREARLASSANGREPAPPFAVYSFIMSVILTVLVALNFFFDWRKRGGTVQNPFALDLRRKG